MFGFCTLNHKSLESSSIQWSLKEDNVNNASKHTHSNSPEEALPVSFGERKAISSVDYCIVRVNNDQRNWVGS